MINFENFSEGQKYLLRKGAVFFVVLANVLVLAIALFYLVSSKTLLRGDVQTRPQISVSGEGKVSVRPDIASFTVTVVTEAKRVGDAQKDNTMRSNAALDFIKQNGVEEKDIKTVNYSIEPQYQYDAVADNTLLQQALAEKARRQYERMPCVGCPPLVRTPPQIVSYRVRHSVQVKVRDLAKVDDLLEGAIAAGANEVGSVSFSVDDEKKVMAEAHKKAIEDAEEKAKVLARDLGIRLKKIVGFSESGGGYPIYLRRQQAKSADFEGAVAATPSVEPGEQEVSSNVTIVYEFR